MGPPEVNYFSSRNTLFIQTIIKSSFLPVQ